MIKWTIAVASAAALSACAPMGTTDGTIGTTGASPGITGAAGAPVATQPQAAPLPQGSPTVGEGSRTDMAGEGAARPAVQPDTSGVGTMGTTGADVGVSGGVPPGTQPQAAPMPQGSPTVGEGSRTDMAGEGAARPAVQPDTSGVGTMGTTGADIGGSGGVPAGTQPQAAPLPEGSATVGEGSRTDLGGEGAARPAVQPDTTGGTTGTTGTTGTGTTSR
jgi:hypothetical protein